MAALPGAWRYRVSAGTGRPGVSILWLGEIRPWDALACCRDVKQPTTNKRPAAEILIQSSRICSDQDRINHLLPPLSVYLCLSVCLSVCMYVCLSVCPSSAKEANRGFRTRMVYLKYAIWLRCTILVQNLRNARGLKTATWPWWLSHSFCNLSRPLCHDGVGGTASATLAVKASSLKFDVALWSKCWGREWQWAVFRRS